MDPIEDVDIDADSTFVLALEAQARGHGLYHYLPRDLSFLHGRVLARARALEVRREKGNHFTLGPPALIDLATMDIVLMRQDPPFDMAYITATHLLEHIHPRTLVVNDPVQVRNAPEKLFVTHFADVMPPTLITADAEQVHAFRREHKDIIIKPLFGNGGAGVFHLGPVFQEGDAVVATRGFKQIAKLTNGAHCRFDLSSAKQLRDLLSAVAVYAAGGRKALENYSHKAGGDVRLLVQQVK